MRMSTDSLISKQDMIDNFVMTDTRIKLFDTYFPSGSGGYQDILNVFSTYNDENFGREIFAVYGSTLSACKFSELTILNEPPRVVYSGNLIIDIDVPVNISITANNIVTTVPVTCYSIIAFENIVAHDTIRAHVMGCHNLISDGLIETDNLTGTLLSHNGKSKFIQMNTISCNILRVGNMGSCEILNTESLECGSRIERIIRIPRKPRHETYSGDSSTKPKGEPTLVMHFGA